jgi:hypothetical protein
LPEPELPVIRMRGMAGPYSGSLVANAFDPGSSPARIRSTL